MSVDEQEDRTGEVIRRITPRRERILQRREPWFEDPWDDPERTDALVVERPRRLAQVRPFIAQEHTHQRVLRRAYV